MAALDPTPAFTAFGRVTAAIAACEHIMCLALGKLEVEAAKRAGDAGPERFQRFTRKMMKWDFGQLSHRVKTQFKLPDDPWRQIFRDAKELRNSVAHNFWTPNYVLLRSQRGIDIIVRHCDYLERHFSHLFDGLVHVTATDPQLYIEVISDPAKAEEAIAGYERLLVEAEKAAADFVSWR